MNGSADKSRLSVNVNAVALLRNRRDLPWPSVTDIADIAMRAGAKGITVHPRPDERHIRKTDVSDLTQLISQEHPNKELCLEGYPGDDFLQLIEKYKPHQVLYVPDDPEQSTSDHGWDIAANKVMLREFCELSKSWGIKVALFLDPDPSLPQLAAEVGAERIEIYTGPYGACHNDKVAADAELEKLIATAKIAQECGLGVNAGHDLTVANLPAIISQVPFLREVSIGHGFTADALIYGIEKSVHRFREALGELS